MKTRHAKVSSRCASGSVLQRIILAEDLGATQALLGSGVNLAWGKPLTGHGTTS